MNEDDANAGEMKQLQSVSNLENPFNQGTWFKRYEQFTNLYKAGN